jgi:peptide/nickel transport system substrate-binding protein
MKPIRYALAGALLATSTFFSVAALAQQAGGTLVIGSTQKPRHLNPAVQSGIATAVPGTQIFATPLRFDENWKPQPYLAESWDVSGDGKSITLHLRKNATFHDGKPITSADVAFSIDTVKANHPFKTMFAPVKSVDTPDAHTAVINFANPHPAALLAMSSALLPIIPKHIYGDGQDPKKHPANSKPVGSGPFMLEEFKPGQHIILKKNPNFFIKDRPYLDRVIIKNYKDVTSVVLAADKGEVDMLPFLTGTRNLARLKKNANLTVTNKGYAAVGPLNWLAFNTTHKILKDVRVRKAIAYAIDRKFIVNALHGGFSKIATGPIVLGSPFAEPDVESYALDLDKAKALLDEAGFKAGADGTRFKISLDYIPAFAEMQKTVAEYIKPQLKKIGINVVLRSSPDFPSWAKRIGGHDFEMTMDIVFNWGDPVIGVHRTYICSNIRKGVIWSNTQSYCNKEVDALFARAGMEPNLAKRIELYKSAQKIIVDEVPQVFLNELPYHTVYSNKVGNPPLTIWGAMAPMDNVYKK